MTNKETKLAVLTSDVWHKCPEKKNYFMSSFCTYKLVNSLLDSVIVHSTTTENGTLWNPIHVYLKINPVPEMLALSDFM